MAAKKTKSVKKVESGKPKVPKLIFAQASPHSLGGVSLFEAQEQCNEETVVNFFSDEELIYRAITRLQDAGFEVLQASAVTINIAGSPATFERAFKTKIEAQERPVIKILGKESTATFLESPETELPGLISTLWLWRACSAPGIRNSPSCLAARTGKPRWGWNCVANSPLWILFAPANRNKAFHCWSSEFRSPPGLGAGSETKLPASRLRSQRRLRIFGASYTGRLKANRCLPARQS